MTGVAPSEPLQNDNHCELPLRLVGRDVKVDVEGETDIQSASPFTGALPSLSTELKVRLNHSDIEGRLSRDGHGRA